MRPHEHALQHLGAVAAAEQVRDEVRDRRPPGRVLVQAERDARGVPAARASRRCRRSARRIRSASPQVAALEPARPLDLADREGREHADQHQHREHVDQEREPALLRRATGSSSVCRRPRSAPSGSSGSSTTKPQKMNACMSPGTSRWNSLRWPEHDHRLVLARAAARRRSAATGLPSRTSRYSCRARRPNRPPATAIATSSDEAGDHVRLPRRRRISAAIAGTTSCRSPITA